MDARADGNGTGGGHQSSGDTLIYPWHSLMLDTLTILKSVKKESYSYTIPLHSISLTSKHTATALVFVWTCKVYCFADKVHKFA